MFECVLGPEGADGNASKYATEHSPNSVDDHDGHYSPTQELKSLCREDSLVLKQDRDLCQSQG
jgi:hypothetical protein